MWRGMGKVEAPSLFPDASLSGRRSEWGLPAKEGTTPLLAQAKSWLCGRPWLDAHPLRQSRASGPAAVTGKDRQPGTARRAPGEGSGGAVLMGEERLRRTAGSNRS